MALVYGNDAHLGPALISRSDSLLPYAEHSALMMEKRQLFLKSYQFCRKQSLKERMKTSLIRVKKAIRIRLRSAGKFRRLVWSNLRFAFYCRRRRRFLRLLSPNHRNHSSSSCFS